MAKAAFSLHLSLPRTRWILEPFLNYGRGTFLPGCSHVLEPDVTQCSQEAPKLMVQDGVLAHITNSQPWASPPHLTLRQLPQSKGSWTWLGLTKMQQPGSLRVEGWEHWEEWEVLCWDRRCQGAAPAPP